MVLQSKIIRAEHLHHCSILLACRIESVSPILLRALRSHAPTAPHGMVQNRNSTEKEKGQ